LLCLAQQLSGIGLEEEVLQVAGETEHIPQVNCVEPGQLLLTMMIDEPVKGLNLEFLTFRLVSFIAFDQVLPGVEALLHVFHDEGSQLVAEKEPMGLLFIYLFVFGQHGSPELF
jgi:hypothetical protein